MKIVVEQAAAWKGSWHDGRETFWESIGEANGEPKLHQIDEDMIQHTNGDNREETTTNHKSHMEQGIEN